MPTVGLKRDELFRRLEREYTEDEFAQLCFEFGVELDEVTSEKNEKEKERGEDAIKDQQLSEEVIYKIDVPANRYDLLCMEGMSKALRVFKRLDEPPVYTTTAASMTMNVSSEVDRIRPHVVCAVLRGVTFDALRYQSFIDLQEKLHQNLCRRRTLVSIGTHDLDTIEGPFSYEALAPEQIVFKPLDRTETVNGVQLMSLYENSHLKDYLDIIRSSPVYPVIYDAQRRVLSLPPIINGDHSKITLNTRNVFIEVTATDATKASVVLNIMCAMFAEYCSTPFSIESVNVVKNNVTTVTPNLATYPMTASVDYINKTLALSLTPEQIIDNLKRMMVHPVEVSDDRSSIVASVPITRFDILHECDIMEDVAIAHGYGNLNIIPPTTISVGSQQPLNRLTDQLRNEMAQIGFWETLTFTLCSWDDCFKFLNKENDGKTAVVIDKAEGGFNIVRTNMLPGMLRTIYSNKGTPLPIRLFEIGDVVLKSAETDVGSVNRRHLCAVYYGPTPGFEIIHGVVDFLVNMLGVNPTDFKIQPSENPTYFPGSRADIFIRGTHVGVFGVLHPDVNSSFKLELPCSALEIDIHHFL